MMEQRWVNVRVRVTFRVSGRVSVRAYIGSGTHIGAIFFSGCSTSHLTSYCGLGYL